jgi:NADPH:quinone reductase-like Zn-dependent oxidoreductase
MRYGEARPLPLILGHEFSGVVAEVGRGVTAPARGEAVYGLNDWFRDGAEAEYCVARADEVAAKPRSVDHTHAAAVPISALTAWQGLFGHARLAAGERVLVQRAAGGVGLWAVQLARWRGARVIGTASARNRDFVRGLGADEVIDYRATRFEDAVRDLDVVFDTVGGETLLQLVPLCRGQPHVGRLRHGQRRNPFTVLGSAQAGRQAGHHRHLRGGKQGPAHPRGVLHRAGEPGATRRDRA